MCPGCSLVVAPIFGTAEDLSPRTTEAALAEAICALVDSNVHVINLSASYAYPTPNSNPALGAALDYAAVRDVPVIAAAGNQATIGTSQITRHPAVLPVIAADDAGRPLATSNLSATVGRRGLAAPGSNITSIKATGGTLTWTGTSVAAPFVTATVALLRSIFPSASGIQTRMAVSGLASKRRRMFMPPRLDAAAAFEALLVQQSG